MSKLKHKGTIGIENALTADEIAQADIVLLAADVKVLVKKGSLERSSQSATEMAVKSPNKLIEKLSELVNS